MQTETVVAHQLPSGSKLTGGQKWMIAGLLCLQIPSSLIFYPLAAIFAITGILVPIAMVLMGIGTLPFSSAMKCRDRWRGDGVPEGSAPLPAERPGQVSLGSSRAQSPANSSAQAR